MSSLSWFRYNFSFFRCYCLPTTCLSGVCSLVLLSACLAVCLNAALRRTCQFMSIFRHNTENLTNMTVNKIKFFICPQTYIHTIRDDINFIVVGKAGRGTCCAILCASFEHASCIFETRHALMVKGGERKGKKRGEKEVECDNKTCHAYKTASKNPPLHKHTSSSTFFNFNFAGFFNWRGSSYTRLI